MPTPVSTKSIIIDYEPMGIYLTKQRIQEGTGQMRGVGVETGFLMLYIIPEMTTVN